MRRPARAIFSSHASIVLFAASFQSPTAMWEHRKGSSLDSFGASIASVSDVDGDKCDDLVVGAYNRGLDSVEMGPIAGFSHQDTEHLGTITLLSGRTGAEIKEVKSADAGFGFGLACLAVGGADGHSTRAVAVGAPRRSTRGGGFVELYSLPGLTQLARIEGGSGTQFGYKLGWLRHGKSNETGQLLVGSPSSNGSHVGVVSLYSGANLESVVTVDGPDNESSFGSAVCGLGDLDGDDVPDFAVGAEMARGKGPDRGEVFALSGGNHSVLWHRRGADDYESLGCAICSIPDVNADGIDDLAVGAREATSGELHNVGCVYILSGRDGEVIRRLYGDPAWAEFGVGLARLGDVDGDGVPDFVATTSTASREHGRVFGKARVISGRTMDALIDVDGMSACPLNTLDARGGADFITSACWMAMDDTGDSHIGRVWRWHYSAPPIESKH